MIPCFDLTIAEKSYITTLIKKLQHHHYFIYVFSHKQTKIITHIDIILEPKMNRQTHGLTFSIL